MGGQPYQCQTEGFREHYETRKHEVCLVHVETLQMLGNTMLGQRAPLQPILS